MSVQARSRPGRALRSARRDGRRSKNSPIEIALLAPYNEAVQVLGSFNDWEPQDLDRGDDGWWRLSLDVADGDYEYRFRVKSKSSFALDQWLHVSDPRATHVNSRENDNAVLTVRGGRRVVDEYEWQHDRTPLPPDNELIIYEMHVGGFAAKPDGHAYGTFRDVTSKLDYICRLGVNAIELMPVNEFPGNKSWGYNPRFHFAVESSYGTPTEFKRFVDECHARGIRVLLDLVLNHGESEHPLTKIDHDYWFYHDNPDPENLRWGPKFDYTHFDQHRNAFPAREFARDCAVFWLEEYHLDGFRLDATAIIKRYDFQKMLRDALKDPAVTSGKPVILIGESNPEDPAVTGYDGPMDAAWHFGFNYQLKANLLGREFNGAQPYEIENMMRVLDPRRRGYDSTSNVVNFATSHDEEFEMRELGSAGIFDEPAFRRAKHAATMVFMAPGLPMIRMGEEFGEYSPKSLGDVRLHWELLQQPRTRDLYNYYCRLSELRKSSPVLQAADRIEFIYSNTERKLLAFKRWDDRDGLIVALVNLQDVDAGEVDIPNWPLDGKWREWICDCDLEVEGGILHARLGASEIKIYIKA